MADTPRPRPIARPVPLESTVLYELHVKGFTRLHPAVPEHLRGTYAGLAYPAVIEHLLDLGVTAVELLPVHHFVSEPFLIGRGLSATTGATTPSASSPRTAAYGSVGTLGQQVREFKEMVSALHDAGHRGDPRRRLQPHRRGRPRGTHAVVPRAWTTRLLPADRRPPQRLRRHRLRQLRRHLASRACSGWCSTRCATGSPRWGSTGSASTWSPPCSGTSATTSTRTAPVQAGHAARTRCCSQVKMIAEPWDMGPYGYQVGAFGAGWSEWNDRFRNYVRDFWRGNTPASPSWRPAAGRVAGHVRSRRAGRQPPGSTSSPPTTGSPARPGHLRRQAQRGQRRVQPRRHRRQPVLELRRRGRDRGRQPSTRSGTGRPRT